MAHEPEGNHSDGGPAAEAPLAGLTGTKLAQRPPRPEMSNATPPPIAPTVVKASRLAWMTSFVIGTAACLVGYFSHDAQVKQLEELGTERAPSVDAETLDTIASVVSWSSIGQSCWSPWSRRCCSM